MRIHRVEVPHLPPWRDLPDELGSFQTAHKRLIRCAVEGTWERMLAAVLAAAEGADDIGWTTVSVDSTETGKLHLPDTMPLNTTTGRPDEALPGVVRRGRTRRVRRP